jgi:hypothetical protein
VEIPVQNEIVARGEQLLVAERQKIVLEHMMAQQAFDDIVAKRVGQEMEGTLVAKFDELIAMVSHLCMCVMELEQAVKAPKVRTPVRDVVGQITSVIETTVEPAEGPGMDHEMEDY